MNKEAMKICQASRIVNRRKNKTRNKLLNNKLENRRNRISNKKSRHLKSRNEED